MSTSASEIILGYICPSLGAVIAICTCAGKSIDVYEYSCSFYNFVLTCQDGFVNESTDEGCVG